MGRFWDAATEQAGREFGARHYRWFAGARVFRRLLPVLSFFAILAAVVGGAAWFYRSVDPDWAAAGDRLAGWAGNAGALALWIGGVAVALLVVAGLIALIRRNWWSWWHLSRPMWMRRY